MFVTECKICSKDRKWHIKQKYKNRINYCLVYTGLFFLFFLLTFHSFFIEHRSFVWESDGLGQYIVNLYALYSRIYEGIDSLVTSGTMPLINYSFYVGLGADIVGTYFVSIPEYLGAIFKRENIETTYNFIIIFKIYISGITFSWLCRYFKRPYLSTLAGSFIYVFSGFSLYYGIRHPQFIMPLILLPCLIIGLDQILKGKSPIIFCLLIFYSLWIDYYFLYMNTIILGIFFLVRYFTLHEKRSIRDFLSKVLKIVLTYLIGVGLAFIPFMSKVQDFFNSPRTQSDTLNKSELLTYGEKWIGHFISRLFSPYTRKDYLQHYMLFAVISLALPITIIFLLRKKKKLRPLKIWFLISILFFVLPIAGFIFSGFSATINRWSYGFVLLIAFIAATTLPFMKNINKKDLGVAAITITSFIILCLAYREKNDFSVIVGSFLMAVTFLFVLVFIYLLKHKKTKLAYSSLFILIGINLLINGEYLYSESKGAFASEFVEKGGILTRFTNSLDAIAADIDDDSFYRTELYTNSQHTAGFSKVWNYNGTAIYSSTNNRNIIEYGESLENIGTLTVANFYDFDSRSYLEALSSVKYYIIEEGKESFVPFGFKFKYSTENDGKVICVYENSNYLPLGYTYSSYLSESQYEELNVVEKQEAMLQAALVENHKTDNSDSKKIKFTSAQKQYNSSGKNVHVGKNKIIVDKDNSVLNIEFETSKNYENYIEIKGLNVDNVAGESLAIQISASNGIEKSIWVPISEDLYKLNENNYLINLCNNDKEKITVQIKFPYAGEYTFKELNAFSQSTSNLKEYVSDLKMESLTNTTVNGGTITGEISVSEDKLLCLSIPYSKGWKLYLNGKSVELKKVNQMYLGADIPAGKYKVKLVYKPYGFNIWCLITFISVIGFCVMIFYQLKKKYTSKNCFN